MIKLYYDPQEDGAVGGGVEQTKPFNDSSLDIAGAMGEADRSSEEKPAEIISDKSEEVKSDVKPEPKAEDDPEFDVGYEEETGKGNAKYKLSQLRQQAKWLHENKQVIAATFKIREEAQKNPTFGKAMQTLISKAYNEKGEFNGAAVDGILAQLEAKQEKVEEKIEEKADEIADMEKDLQELDEDSPHAKILQKNINAARSMKKQLGEALNQNKAIQERLDKLDKGFSGIEQEKQQAVTSEKVKQLSSLYEKEIGALSDPAKSDGYKFVDETEKSDFDRAVRDAVAAKSEAIKTDEDFVKTVKEAAKSIYDRMNKRREAYVNDYIRKKNGPTKKEEPKVEKKESRSFEEMGALIGDALMTPSQ